MKYRYAAGALFFLLCFCFYLFHVIYAEAKEKAIAELTSRQMIHAIQAQGEIEIFFNNITTFLTKLSESDQVIDFNHQGRKDLDLALAIRPEGIKAITRVDASGKIMYTAPFDKGAINKDISGQKHVKKILMTQKPVISDVFIAVQGYRAIALHVPVFNGAEFRGTLAVLVDFLSISKRFLHGIRLGKTGYAWMISREGIELFCPVPGHTGKSVFETSKEFPSIVSMAEKMVKGEHGTATYKFDRIKDQKTQTILKHAVYMPIKIVDSFWSIVVASSEDEVLADLVSFKNKLLMVVGLLLICSGIFSYYSLKAWGIVQEETERKKAAVALFLSNKRYQTLFHDSPVPLWEEDFTELYGYFEELRQRGISDFRDYFVKNPSEITNCVQKVTILDVNQATLKLHGARNKEDLMGNLDKLFTERSLNVFKEELIAIADGRTEFETEGEVKTLSGDARYVFLKLKITTEQQGQKIALLSTTDITSRKKAEEALRLSHERFLKVLNSIDASVYVSDLKTYEILFMNKYMTTIFGKDMTGETCWKVFTKESKPCSHCANHLLVDKKGNPSGVCTWQGKNSVSGKWFINSDRAIQWTDGRMVKLQIGTDISHTKKLEEELRQAHKMESIGTLAGGIAHDFNNILSIIIGNTELALDDTPDFSPAHNNIQEIKTASLRAKNVVRQLLSFTRKTEQEQKPLDIVPLIKESLKLIKSSIPSSIEIRETIPDINCSILADATQIHQVIINLCTNAAQAMSENGGILEIAVNHVDHNIKAKESFDQLPPGRYIEVLVKDTGQGIDSNIREKIFDPYFTTKDVGKGTGMGLAVVHGIVENHNGHISVDSEAGKGSSFRVFFPMVSEQPGPKSKELMEKHPHGTETILFVDDEESIIGLAKQVLKPLGYNVKTKTRPKEALEMFEADPDKFDLVISDMTMPQMDGVTLTKKLKALRPDVPIIICTGHSSVINEENAKKAGVSAYIMKPMSMSKLATLIREALET